MRASPRTSCLSIVALLAACSGIRESSAPAQETRSASSFTAVEAGGAVEIVVDVGPATQVEIQGENDAVKSIRTEVVEDTLVISSDDWLDHDGRVKIAIKTPTLDGIEASGAVHFDVRGVDTRALDVEASGASRVEIRGKAARLDANVSGASRLKATELDVEDAEVHASGASEVEVTVHQRLDAHASGASRVTYQGNPSGGERHESGASSIRAR